MSEDIQVYGIKFKFDKSLDKLQKMQAGVKNFNKMQEASLRRQIKLQSQLSSVSKRTTTSSAPRGASAAAMTSSSAPANQAALAAEREARALAKVKEQVKNSTLMLRKATNETHRLEQETLKVAMRTATTTKELRAQVALSRARVMDAKILTRQAERQRWLMERMKSSSKQFAGNMLGAFAIAAGARSVVKTGQDFEAVRNTMLAVSEDSVQAGENFQFVKDSAFELGLGLKESAKGFAKMVAARGDMTLDDTKEAFLGVAEMSTLLGLSEVETTRATNALMQMMSKGTITSEELKQQMGEVMPNAMKVMAGAAKDAGISVSGTVEEMFKLQEQGLLVSSKVLPHFGKNMRKAARENGGLEKALKSNRVAMNQMVTSFQNAADEMFKSGLAEGLTALFKSIGGFINDNMDLWKSLGTIIGGTLKAVAVAIKIISVPLQILGVVLKGITDILGDFSAILLLPLALSAVSKIGMITTALMGTTGAVGALTAAMRALAVSTAAALAPWWPVLAVLTAVAGVIKTIQTLNKATPEYVDAWKARGGVSARGFQNTMKTSEKTPATINTVVQLDKEVLVSAVSKSSMLENTVDNRIAHHS